MCAHGAVHSGAVNAQHDGKVDRCPHRVCRGGVGGGVKQGKGGVGMGIGKWVGKVGQQAGQRGDKGHPREKAHSVTPAATIMTH